MPTEKLPISLAMTPPGPGLREPAGGEAGECLLVLTGLMGAAAVTWVSLLKWLGHDSAVSIVLAFLALSALAMAAFLRTRRLQPFASLQLALILYAPFCAQWAAGSFVTTGGLALWALMAPAGAAALLGLRRSLPWGIAWLAITLASAMADYVIAGPGQRVDLQTSGGLFAINVAGVSLWAAWLAAFVASRKAQAEGRPGEGPLASRRMP